MEQPPSTMPPEQREYLARQLTALKNVDNAQLPVLTALPTKPLAGKLYYFANTIGTTITQAGLWLYTNAGWQSFLKLIGGVLTGQLQLTGSNNAADGGGQIYLNGATGNRIDFNVNGFAAPAFTTRSAGTKIVLYPFVSATFVDYAIGIEPNIQWFSIPQNVSTFLFKWYGGITKVMQLDGTGNLSAVGSILSSSATAGVGYTTGAGGTVTQLTSKATGVTLNKVCGTITMNAASLAANTAVSFTLTNSAIAATDNIIIQQAAGTVGAYDYGAASFAAGSCVIWLNNHTAGALAEAVQLRFSIIKSANA